MDSIKDYINQLDQDEQLSFNLLRDAVKSHIPKGFKEIFMYNMITYVVPLEVYPNGYHVAKDTPLPFISLAKQKKHYTLYHMGIYQDKGLLDWFNKTYEDIFHKKPNMGKSCIRFTKVDDQVIDLISKLVQKLSVSDYIALYESSKV